MSSDAGSCPKMAPCSTAIDVSRPQRWSWREASGADRWKQRPRFYRYRLMEGERFEDTTEVNWVFGAFLLVRFDRFLALGGMDERFRLYYEDVDLCYRFRQRGWRTFYFPAVTVVHQHARSSAAKPFGQAWRWHLWRRLLSSGSTDISSIRHQEGPKSRYSPGRSDGV